MNSAPAWIAKSAALCLTAMLLVAAIGPLATDDLWWHLGLGHVYADRGLAIEADPHLHTALKAPPANAWLFDWTVAQLDSHFGLQVLRGAHALLLLGILILVGRLLYVRSRSATYASLGVCVFIACAAYRLVQFRPDLLTLLATAGLAGLLFARRAAPTRVRAALAVLLCALWSNLHPGFLLGPVLIATAAAGAALGALVGTAQSRAADRNRAWILAGLSGAGLLATTLNPDGFASLLRYFEAGLESAGQATVVDEWRGFTPFVRPHTTLPPAPLAFGVFWLALIVTPIALAHSFRDRFQERESTEGAPPLSEPTDLSVAVLAFVGILAPFVAVRFLWLILFPLLLGADRWRAVLTTHPCHDERREHRTHRVSAVVAALSLMMIPFYWLGAERAAIPSTARTKNFVEAFDTDRYSAHAVWFLADSEVEGRLFHPYFMGGFLDYWLAPQCQTFIDGSLNVPPAVLADYGRFQAPTSEHREAILDSHEIDFFVGVGLPSAPLKGRPWRYTANDLAHKDTWILVFRNLRSAVYMKRHPRNAENLARIVHYYARAGIPFSETRGLDLALVLSDAPEWAVAHGVAPHDFVPLRRAALGRGTRISATMRALAQDRLATTYAVLDLCAEALAVDRDALRAQSVDTASLGASRATTRKRRMQACQARLAEPAATRMTWLTPVEAGRIKGVQRKALGRTRTRHAGPAKNYSGSQ